MRIGTCVAYPSRRSRLQRGNCKHPVDDQSAAWGKRGQKAAEKVQLKSTHLPLLLLLPYAMKFSTSSGAFFALALVTCTVLLSAYQVEAVGKSRPHRSSLKQIDIDQTIGHVEVVCATLHTSRTCVHPACLHLEEKENLLQDRCTVPGCTTSASFLQLIVQHSSTYKYILFAGKCPGTIKVEAEDQDRCKAGTSTYTPGKSSSLCSAPKRQQMIGH
jgi:hypothetical protein